MNAEKANLRNPPLYVKWNWILIVSAVVVQIFSILLYYYPPPDAHVAVEGIVSLLPQLGGLNDFAKGSYYGGTRIALVLAVAYLPMCLIGFGSQYVVTKWGKVPKPPKYGLVALLAIEVGLGLFLSALHYFFYWNKSTYTVREKPVEIFLAVGMPFVIGFLVAVGFNLAARFFEKSE